MKTLDRSLSSFGNAKKSVLPLSMDSEKAEVLVMTTFPPKECGLATYSQDLIKAIHNKFQKSFELKVCAIESHNQELEYNRDVKYVLNTSDRRAFTETAALINKDSAVKLVLIQHEFGLFHRNEKAFLEMLLKLEKPVITVFHTILPRPNPNLRQNVIDIFGASSSIVVMTENAKKILERDYLIDIDKVTVIKHGTHLVEHSDKVSLKEKYGYRNRKILSTFGLLSAGKSIETTLDALPKIIKTKPEVLFLIIGKTHPNVVEEQGEKYRDSLRKKIKALKLENHVQFVNKYLGLEELLEYLQLTDIYLFTSKDPNQAVSGTFSYAASCGCAIISTKIPHAVEFLSDDSGIVIDFGNSEQLAEGVNRLLFDVKLRDKMRMNALHKIVGTAWENSAVAHAILFEKMSSGAINLRYKMPEINLSHIKNLTTDFGMIQFSKINKPDFDSGYTIDDNARAMIAMCQHFELSRDKSDLIYINIYLDFIRFCQQADGRFLNYVNIGQVFSDQNSENLEDSNGRTIWALGNLISHHKILPVDIVIKASAVLEKVLPNVENIHSTRAMAFIIKGLYFYNQKEKSSAVRSLVKKFADRLTQMYLHESSTDWNWFEGYLTYGNSILPEALLLAHIVTDESMYRDIAKSTFDFLLQQTFNESEIKVVSNRSWMQRNGIREEFGEQPIDVAYTVIALVKFYDFYGQESYKVKIHQAFDWFMGKNHLRQILYNPCTGGCYDGLEQYTINLNQGAESTISYLMARLCLEKLNTSQKTKSLRIQKFRNEPELTNYSFVDLVRSDKYGEAMKYSS